MDTTFIYGLIDPRPGKRKAYVGKSDEPERRFKEHVSPSFGLKEPNYKANWIKGLLALRLKPKLIIIDEVIDKEWQAAEAAYIQFYKEEGWELVNGTLGGEGLDSGEDHPSKRLDVRAKMSATWKGKVWPPEVQARRIAALRAALARPEVRAKLKAAMARPEVRAKRSAALRAALKGKVKSPRHLKNIKAALARPEVKARKSMSMEWHCALKYLRNLRQQREQAVLST